MYKEGDRPSGAVTIYQKILTVDPNDQSALYHCASAYQKAGRRSDAIAMYTRLMQLAPTGTYAGRATAALEELQSGQ